MIHVDPQPEPPDFDEKVRKPGLKFLKDNPDCSVTELKAYWRNVLPELWEEYHGICAYLAIFFEKSTGASSVDHFVPKYKNRKLAYEWRNYRLSCLGANVKKHTSEVLDPFKLEENAFVINFSDGSIRPNRDKAQDYQILCQKTIDILSLNDSSNKKMRKGHFDDYRKKHVSLDYLRRKSPFVYSEIVRQGLQ